MGRDHFVSRLIELAPQTKKSSNHKKSRYRRCRSAPSSDSFHVLSNGHNDNNNNKKSHLNPKSIFGRIRPSFTKVFVLLALYLGLGTLCFYLVRNQIKGKKTNPLLDSVYFSIVTMTTVGYGDLVPDSPLAKLIACAYVFTGIALVGHLLSRAADYLVERQEILLVKALRNNSNENANANSIEILREIQTNRVRYKTFLVFTLLLVLVITGTVFLVTVEKLSFVDALYCVCSTITTLGYGDISFTTEEGRIFAVIWIVMSTVLLGQFFLYLAELTTERRQSALVKWVRSQRMTNVDLEAADLDEDGDVVAAEFIIYKLKQMGKISEADITVLMKEFEELDVDESGTLSPSDILIAQSSPRVT